MFRPLLCACAVLLWSVLPTAPAAAADPLAVAEGRVPGVRAEIVGLSRSRGEVLTLEFRIVNDGDRAFESGGKFRETGGDPYDSVSGVYLLDQENGKKYLVLRDSEGQPVAGTFDKIPAQSSALLWAKFPAPPADVDVVSVVIPHFAPADDVPIGD